MPSNFDKKTAGHIEFLIKVAGVEVKDNQSKNFLRELLVSEKAKESEQNPPPPPHPRDDVARMKSIIVLG
jgi:hypothetical protein